MKTLILFFSLFLSINIYAQSIEVIGGYTHNSFTKAINFSELSSESGSGNTLKVAMTGKKTKFFNWRLTIGYDNYRGEIISTSGIGGGFGGSINRYDIKINKSIFTLGIFPLNFKFWDKVDLNFGFEISNLFRDGYEGTYESSNSFTGLTTIEDIQKLHSSFNTKVSIGMSVRIAYDIKVGNNLYLSPQYAFYTGLIDEFKTGIYGIRSLRHNFGLGIEWKL